MCPSCTLFKPVCKDCMYVALTSQLSTPTEFVSTLKSLQTNVSSIQVPIEGGCKLLASCLKYSTASPSEPVSAKLSNHPSWCLCLPCWTSGLQSQTCSFSAGSKEHRREEALRSSWNGSLPRQGQTGIVSQRNQHVVCRPHMESEQGGFLPSPSLYWSTLTFSSQGLTPQTNLTPGSC